MKKLTVIFATIAVCLGISGTTFAQKARPTPSPTPDATVNVTAKFEPIGTDGTTINRVTMDNYSIPYTHGVDAVAAQFHIDTSRDLTINLRTSTRTAWYDLSQVTSATAGSKPAWTVAPQRFNPGMNILEAYRAKENCTYQTPAGSGIYDCNFVTKLTTVNLVVSGYNYTYRLLWNPEPATSTPVNSPEMTSFVKVNYYKGLDNQEVFTITPLPNCATRANGFTCPDGVVQKPIAGLEATTTGNGRQRVTAAGQYVMPFTLVVRPCPSTGCVTPNP